MTKMLSVAVGGGLGAVLRYWVQGWTQDRLGASFPFGTLLVNISGAFMIGLLMTVFLEHVEVSPPWRLFLVIGVLGGYTTFSSLTWETYQLFSAGSFGYGCLYMGSSFLGGMIALLSGVFIGRLL